MRVRFDIKRYDPEKDEAPYFQNYEVELGETDRVLDGLNEIRWRQDGTLTFRRSCEHGICGSDAMRINGRNRLACKTLIREVGRRVRIEPLLGFPVVRDLVVDQQRFFQDYRSVLPFLVNDDPPPPRERLQSPEARRRFDDTTKCILCAACTTACPSAWGNDSFLGPAAIVQAHRFIFDTRDHATVERLARLAGRCGVWACRTAYNCTMACPREIQVTRAIAEVKRAALLGGP
ncbi:MAG: succinate dehydrogenase iron-sulfur subunit [Gemmatimonadota bacterium]|nr:MAG: succinate dehydrogenase iron-sulfur subunit [Gemmatimonadota bacterium]